MGRKIPSKKHRGVKDPLVQQAKRLQSLKSKINAPPKDPDEQPVPRSLTRLFEFQNKSKGDKALKKKKTLKRLEHARGHSNYNARGVGDNPISRLRKLPGETGRDFSLRINSAMKALHNPTEDLDYPTDLIEEDDEKGARMAAQRERRARKNKRDQKQAERDGRGQESSPQQPPHSRTQRLAAKKLHKKQKALEAQQEKHEVVYERVAFGEVCDAPPTLRPNRKLAARPGRRDLLLTSMLASGTRPAPAPALPPAEVQRRERARLDAIAAYRALRTTRTGPTHRQNKTHAAATRLQCT